MTPMQQMFLGGGKPLTTWELNKPSWMPMESSVPAPYAWYDWEDRNGSEGWDNSSNKWTDRSGNNRLSEVSGGSRTTTGTGRNLSASVDCWRWPTTSASTQIIDGWPGNANVTMIHMTSYDASGGTTERMWQANGTSGSHNWFIGHWDSGTGRYYMGNGFLEQSADIGNVFAVHYAEITNVSNYGAGMLQSSGTQNNYDNTDGGNGVWPTSNVGICMNNGPYGEPSTGDCIFLGIWNTRLTITQRQVVLTAAKNNYL